MTKALPRDPVYRRRRFPPETIELCVRWYITYRLSYRDLVAMMAERDIFVSHTTILRWVLRYVPEFEKRWARHSRPVNSSWRMDETAIAVGGRSRYLYRAVDGQGRTVDSLLCTDRSRDSAQAFFQKAVATQAGVWPRTVNMDGNVASHQAVRLLAQEDQRWQSVVVRGRHYLNNIVEQDHRAIKSRCAPMLGFKSFGAAAITLAGIELAHRIRKRQFRLGTAHRFGSSSLKQLWDSVLAAGGGTDCRSTGHAHPPAAANAPEPHFGGTKSAVTGASIRSGSLAEQPQIRLISLASYSVFLFLNGLNISEILRTTGGEFVLDERRAPDHRDPSAFQRETRSFGNRFIESNTVRMIQDVDAPRRQTNL